VTDQFDAPTAASSSGEIIATKSAGIESGLLSHFNAVLETIDYAVLFMGPDLRSRIINRAFKEMWKISDEFIRTTRPTMADLVRYVHTNHHLYDVPEGEFDAFLARRVEAVVKGSASTEMRLRDGRVIEFHIQSLPDGGRLLTYFDITKLKRSEEAAREASKLTETALSERGVLLDHFNAVLETIEYAVLFMGPDLRSRIINRAFKKMWKISDEFIRTARPTMADLVRYVHSNHHLYDIPEAEFDAFLLRRVEAVVKGSASSEMRLRDGRVIHFQIQSLPDGGRLLTYFDITELKRSEETAKQAKQAAEIALAELKFAQNRLIQTEKLASLGQLTAGIAHEIKNPLNFINNFSEVSLELLSELRESVLSKPAADPSSEIVEFTDMVRANLEKVRQHGQRADGIVKNMLMHSRESSREWTAANINTIVDDSLSLAYYGNRSDRECQVALDKLLDPAAGKIEMFPQDVTRALLNLISNGIYATLKQRAKLPEGTYEPALKVSTRNLGDAVEVIVWDNGDGIAPDIRDKIFNPFFTTKPPGEGSGLGLSLTHDIIVKQHGGTIDFDSSPGEFAEFRVILPRSAARQKLG
jgi:signal transduction histidine kinase